MATSQNGYIANDPSRVSSRLVPGTTRKLTVRNGAPGDLLLEWAAWFDKNVEDIDAARAALDDWGYAERPIRGSATELSNHASGTAIDLNAPRHWLGARNTFTDAQEKKIRAQLRVYDGCIRWGGDYVNRADEMHFEIVASPEKCEATLRKIRNTTTEDDMPTPEETRKIVAEEVEKALAAKVIPVPADWSDKDTPGQKVSLAQFGEMAMKELIRQRAEGNPPSQ